MKKIVIAFLLITYTTFGQEQTVVNLSNPNATIYTHLYFLQPDSYQPKKAALTIQGFTGKEAQEKAIKIKQILDGKGLFVNFNKVPTSPTYVDSLGYGKYNKYVLFPTIMPQIYVEKVGNKWLYAKETLANLNAIYNDVFPWYIRGIQKIIPNAGHTKLLGIQLWQIIALFFMLLIVIILYYFIKKISYQILQKIQYRITKRKNTSVQITIKKLAHPLGLLFSLGFIDAVFPSLNLGLPVNKWVFLSIHIAQTIFWVYVFLKLVGVIMAVFKVFSEKTHGKLDDQLIPILNNFLTGLVVFFGILRLLTLLGINTTALITGVSIGGLAIALASQDTVKNLIGTVMIFLDKPFHIGDWVVAGEVIGSVEEVGFRSTRVRAADTSVFQIPNSKLAEIVINNKGLLRYRRYTTTLGVRYDTPPELLEGFIAGIRKLIEAHPETRSEAYNVEFSGFGDSSLQILVNTYFKNLSWDIEQASKHKLHLGILNLANALGIEFAFPSSTIMVEQFPDKNTMLPKYNTNPSAINNSIEKTVITFSNTFLK